MLTTTGFMLSVADGTLIVTLFTEEFKPIEIPIPLDVLLAFMGSVFNDEE